MTQKRLLPLLFISLGFFSMTAEARYVLVNSNGSSHVYCAENSGFGCLTNAKNRAESDSLMDAENRCRIQHRGRPEAYRASHSTTCNPFTLPPQHPGTWVRCNTKTNMPCNVPN